MQNASTPSGHFGAPHQPPYYPPAAPMRPGPPEEALANQGVRLGARVLDALIVGIGAVIVGTLMGVLVILLTDDEAAATPALITVLAGSYLLYDPLMTYAWGATLGKRICGLRVARLEDGQNLSLGAALGRWLTYLVLSVIPFVGWVNALSCLWDKPYRQCFHDKAASSVVVRRDA